MNFILAVNFDKESHFGGGEGCVCGGGGVSK